MDDLKALKVLEDKFKISISELVDNEQFTDENFRFNLNSYKLDNQNNVTSLKLHNVKQLYHKNFFLHLSKFDNLVDLEITKSKLVDISNIFLMKNLVNLTLSDNEIHDIGNLKYLKNIKYLDLSNNKIDDYTVVNKLEKLNSLIISRNPNSDFNTLQENENILRLEVSENNLADIDFVKKFRGIKDLDLSNNKIVDINVLSQCKTLKILNLQRNKIVDLSPLSSLDLLEDLDLLENRIKNLDPLANLVSLVEINLGHNLLTNIDSLAKLKKLRVLWLIGNKIRNTNVIKTFDNLNSLSLGKNGIDNIDFISELKEMSRLHLQENNIIDISPLQKLEKLDDLNLTQNQIENIDVLRNFKRIRSVNLNYNNISQLPSWIVEIGLDIVWEQYSFLENKIAFYENPLKSPPVEIIKQGLDSIKRYFERISEQGEDFIYEVKLTLVGEGNAGKTSLQKRLLNERASLPKKETRTRGIEIKDWKFKREKNKTHIAHIWDFGGQDVYYPVHRFFITENSVFVLLASTRQTHHNFDYWIPTIHQFGDRSPIVLGQTCHDGNKIPWNDLGVFVGDANFNIIKTQQTPYYEINLPNNNEGLAKLKQTLIDQIVNLPHYGKGVPKSWVPVRNILDEESKKRACISMERFIEICRNSNPISFLNQQDINDCCQFLHDIGVVLWYSAHEELADWVILQPEWAMNAVYKIIDDEEIQKRGGNILSKDFRRLWKDSYFEDKHLVLKKMLEIFKIAFPKKHKKEDYIIPARLLSMPNEQKWKDESVVLSLEYVYQFMPRGLVNQLSAELSRYIPNVKEVWNNAVNFYMDNETAKCQVIEDFYNRKMTIKSKGSDARSLIILVMDSLKNITDGFKGVKPQINVPCACESCKTISKPTMFSYDKLLEWTSKRENATVFCNESATTLTIDELLFNLGLPNPEKRKNTIMKNKTITIFLASSSELKNDREKFEIFINRENKKLNEEGVFLKLELWEDFIDSMSQTRLQDEYNKVVKSSDIFISLFWTKVGKYTSEEFESAFNQFKETNKPRIYTYFKNDKIEMSQINKDDINSKFEFEEKLKNLGHFPTNYDSIEALKFHFKSQLDLILPAL